MRDSPAGQWGILSAGISRVVAISARSDSGDDGIFEEGASAAAVGLTLNDQHALAVTDLANGVVDVDGLQGRLTARKVILQVCIAESRGRM